MKFSTVLKVNKREDKILQLLALEKSYQEIANELGESEENIKTEIDNLFFKLKQHIYMDYRKNLT